MSVDVHGSVVRIVEGLLASADKGGVVVTLGVALHGEEGLGLDSLQTAELSAVLEDVFGTDPFSEGQLPETVGEIVDFYVSGEESGASVPA